MMKKKIMLVDDSKSNLVVGKNVLSEFYETYSVLSGDRLFKLLEKVTPDLILLDVEMPDMNGFQVLERLKQSESTRDIPVIFLTGKRDPDSELDGLTLGAVDYITKPFSPPLLLKRIEVHLLLREQQKELQCFNANLKGLVEEKTRTVVELENAIVQGFAEVVEFRDNATGDHIEHTQRYLTLLWEGMQESHQYEEALRQWNNEFFLPSAQLHDVGKIAVPDRILLKPGKLTPEEYEEIKKHPQSGAKMIRHIARKTKDSEFLRYAEIFALTHHERWDGKGYPMGTAGEETPLPGRMLAIVDVYDALVSVRPYKQSMTHAQAVQIIKEGRGTQFDPQLVDIFLSINEQFEAVKEQYED